MKENKYRITYKNGNTLECKAMSMILKDDKVYQACISYPFDNVVPSVIDGSKIEKIECIEKNNALDDEVEE